MYLILFLKETRLETQKVFNYLKNLYIYHFQGALFDIQTYSSFKLENSYFLKNFGGILTTSERAQFFIFKNFFLNNYFYVNTIFFKISILAVGTINNCYFSNNHSLIDSCFLQIFNALDEIIFDVK